MIPSILCPRRSRGFTLIETILVISLMALMLAISAVYLAGTLPSARLNATAREMTALIRFASSTAAAKGEAQSVVIDLDSGRYGMVGRGLKAVNPGILIRIADPFYGVVTRGRYTIQLQSTGGAEGGTILLQGGRRTVSLYLDPVVGIQMVRQ